jgi:hypothetical protein
LQQAKIGGHASGLLEGAKRTFGGMGGAPRVDRSGIAIGCAALQVSLAGDEPQIRSDHGGEPKPEGRLLNVFAIHDKRWFIQEACRASARRVDWELVGPRLDDRDRLADPVVQ